MWKFQSFLKTSDDHGRYSLENVQKRFFIYMDFIKGLEKVQQNQDQDL